MDPGIALNLGKMVGDSLALTEWELDAFPIWLPPCFFLSLLLFDLLLDIGVEIVIDDIEMQAKCLTSFEEAYN